MSIKQKMEILKCDSGDYAVVSNSVVPKGFVEVSNELGKYGSVKSKSDKIIIITPKSEYSESKQFTSVVEKIVRKIDASIQVINKGNSWG